MPQTCGRPGRPTSPSFPSPTGWGNDKPGIITVVDRETRHTGRASVRIQDTGRGDPVNGHGRLYQEVRVTPFRAYEISVWIKTQKLTDPAQAQFYFEDMDGGQDLVYANREAGLGAPLHLTQDWTNDTVRFNSGSNTRLALFMGL